MPSRKPARGKTTTSGLGHRHKQQRLRLLRELVDGSPCQLCGLPIWKQTQRLHADHSQPRAVHGPHVLADRIVHAECNMREGGRLRARLAGQQVRDDVQDDDRTGLAMCWP